MSAPRRILVLDTGIARDDGLDGMVGALAVQGAEVSVRRCDGDYDSLLDAIAAADSVICWK